MPYLDDFIQISQLDSQQASGSTEDLIFKEIFLLLGIKKKNSAITGCLAIFSETKVTYLKNVTSTKTTYSVIRDARSFEEPITSELVGMDTVVVRIGTAVVVVITT